MHWQATKYSAIAARALDARCPIPKLPTPIAFIELWLIFNGWEVTVPNEDNQRVTLYLPPEIQMRILYHYMQALHSQAALASIRRLDYAQRCYLSITYFPTTLMARTEMPATIRDDALFLATYHSYMRVFDWERFEQDYQNVISENDE